MSEKKQLFFAPLESARGLAAILVAAFHVGQSMYLTRYGVRDQLISSTDQSSGLDSWLSYVYSIFAAGGPISPPVLFFFVLSGFVLSYSLQRSGVTTKLSLEFVVRRVFRIYPAAIATILLFWFLNSVFGLRLSGDFSVNDVFHNALLLDVSINGVMWTLQTELIGSVVILLAMSVVSIAGRRSMLAMCGLLAMLSLFKFWYEYDPFGTAWSRTAYLHAFLFGSLAFLYGKDVVDFVKWRGALLLIGIAVFFFAVPVIVGTQNPIPYRSTIISVAIIVQSAAAAIIVAVLAFGSVRSASFLNSNILTFFGRISFSLYLLHPITLMLMWSQQDSTGIAPIVIGYLVGWGIPNAFVAVILTIASVLFITPLAYVFWRFIEMPVSDLCKRFFDGSERKVGSQKLKKQHDVPSYIFACSFLIFLVGGGAALYVFAYGVKLPASCANNFSSATIISGGSGKVVGSNKGASNQIGELGHIPFSKPYNSVWCRWTAPESGTYAFETTGSDFDTVLAVYASTSMDSMPVAVSNNDKSEVEITSYGEFKAEKGFTYSIAIDGNEGSVGNYILKWSKIEG
ncbi:acyltransferase family protein [Pseudomonas carnis]|uniref:acyltransferase family protein n=1 Tax=Pseudomonas carnis TaxID=2487355 RepID=UPI0019695EFC|nr:acyltransferase [Pseudomonas carnis]